MTSGSTSSQRWFRQADVWLAVPAIIAIGTGLVALKSVALNGSPTFFARQVIWAVAGLAAMAAATLLDVERVSRYSRLLYLTNLALLGAVLVVGHASKGSVRWFGTETFRFQPSELAKLLIALTLADLFARNMDHLRKPGFLLKTLLHIGIPLALILKQPDLGTSLTLAAIWLGMAFVAGVPLRYLSAFALGGLLLFALAWRADVIHDYQKERLLAVLRPNEVSEEARYQVRQAQIAIGSGKVSGKGFAQGTQAHRRFVPERQTDFIFTVLAEEGGFVVGIAVIGLYTLLLLRGWQLVATTRDVRSRLVAAGLVAMMGFHVYVNLGMTLGIMPVTGVPLPFISYGGTAMLVFAATIGVLVGISARREPLVF